MHLAFITNLPLDAETQLSRWFHFHFKVSAMGLLHLFYIHIYFLFWAGLAAGHVKQMIIYANVSSRSCVKKKKNWRRENEKKKLLRVAQVAEGNPKIVFSLFFFVQWIGVFFSHFGFFGFPFCADMPLSFILFISVRFAFYNKLLLCFIVSLPFAEPSNFFCSLAPGAVNHKQIRHTYIHTHTELVHFWPDIFPFLLAFMYSSACIWVMSCLSGQKVFFPLSSLKVNDTIWLYFATLLSLMNSKSWMPRLAPIQNSKLF